ncbi:hypothetical protein QEG98_42145 (plasmid) [Myxococcus sp. MxC21-1]|uniref:hypothetical protein n=1 Tax=Myxococcus sp. MxC21-1 TaxID=3041439 RepID=UPI00292D568A|nr:hypothetical protein [Myxococcus sp. MxC21-1]WNZ66223.1 hypothetical protein QEG98_42145 [Myxococcus sp. MxC21-1]
MAFLRAGPTPSWHLSGFVWRAMLFTALLTYYPTIFGTVVKTTRSVADAIGAQHVYDNYQSSMKALVERMRSANAQVAREFLTDDAEAEAPGWVASKVGAVTAEMGGMVFNAILTLIILLGVLAHWVLGQLASILIATFLVIGPLALVVAIAAGGGIALRWFTKFATYCTWPIVSTVLLALAGEMLTTTLDSLVPVTAGGNGSTAANATAALEALKGVGTSLVLMATALSTPALSSALVAMGAQNFAGQSSMQAGRDVGDAAQVAKKAVETKAAAATGGASAAAKAAADSMGERTSAAVNAAMIGQAPGANGGVAGAAAAMLRSAPPPDGATVAGGSAPPRLPPANVRPVGGAPTVASPGRTSNGSTTIGRQAWQDAPTNTSYDQAMHEARTRTSASQALRDEATKASPSQAHREGLSEHARLEAELPMPSGYEMGGAASPVVTPLGSPDGGSTQVDADQTLAHVAPLSPLPAGRPDAPTVMSFQDATGLAPRDGMAGGALPAQSSASSPSGDGGTVNRRPNRGSK